MTTVFEHRSRIAALKAKRAALVEAPGSHSESRTLLERWCAEQAAEADVRLRHTIASVAYGGSLGGMLKIQPFPGGTVDIGPYLAALLGPQVMSTLLFERYIVGTENGPTASERAEQIAALDAQVFEEECAEERLIEASEAAGLPIARRGDGDPAAVLSFAAPDNPPAPTPQPQIAPRALREAADPAPRPQRVRSEYLTKPGR